MANNNNMILSAVHLLSNVSSSHQKKKKKNRPHPTKKNNIEIKMNILETVNWKGNIYINRIQKKPEWGQ